jgi:hypothetical protein
MPRSLALVIGGAGAAAVLATALAGASPAPPDRIAAAARDDNNVIVVRGTKCPKSHPHKVGSSAASWTRIDDGRIVHRSRRSSICAR